MVKHPDFPFPLYLVLSSKACVKQDFLKVAEEAIQGGVDCIQFREKGIQDALFLERAIQLKKITDQYNIPLIINDNLQVAQAIDAYGIHVGRSDISPTEIYEKWPETKSVGYSIELLEQLYSAESKLAKVWGISPIFRTETKTDTISEWGIEGLRKIRRHSDKALVAIGNMQLNTVREIMQAGANSIAVVSAICAADDPRKAAYELKKEILSC